MNNYQVIRQLQTSLYGEIILCESTRTKETVAIKYVNLEKARSQRTLRDNVAVHENIWTELETLIAIRKNGGHKNIVEFKDVHYDDKNMHIVMEHCAQGDLFNHVLDASPLTTAKSLELFKQIVDGVAFLHSIGFAHLDLSLENILIDEHGVCKLADFGLAVKAKSRSKKIVGKKNYMAPEVVKGQMYDPKQADSWSLGIILYTLLTGSFLFESAASGDKAFDYFTQKGLAALIKARGESIPLEAMLLLENLLQLKPSHRIQVKDVQAPQFKAPISLLKRLTKITKMQWCKK